MANEQKTRINYPHPGNLNGSGAQERAEAHGDALKAIQQLRDALARLAPHGRDWQYSVPREHTGYREAREIHAQRMKELDALRVDIMDEALQWLDVT